MECKGGMKQLCEKFPKLHPLRILGNIDGFEGYIEIMGNDYYICIKTPNFPKAENISINGDVSLLEGFKNYHKAQNDSEDLSVVEYLQDLEKKFEGVLKSSKTDNFLHFDAFSYCSVLISHIEMLGWTKVVQISPNFSSFILEAKDSKNRVHQLRIKIPEKYPSEPPVAEADLPYELDFIWNQSCNLLDIYDVWEKYLKSMQLFWDVMDSLDETACIIDPQNPTRKHCMRRIILENQISIQLIVSHEHPLGPPKCQFLGPSSLISPLNDKLIEQIENWDPSNSIITNLEHLLGVSVLKKQHYLYSEALEWEMECAVCYSLHLEEQLPDMTCDHCHKCFHLSCLYDWLKCLPSSRQTAQFIRGDCPYCTKAISCKVDI